MREEHPEYRVPAGRTTTLAGAPGRRRLAGAGRAGMVGTPGRGGVRSTWRVGQTSVPDDGTCSRARWGGGLRSWSTGIVAAKSGPRHQMGGSLWCQPYPTVRELHGGSRALFEAVARAREAAAGAGGGEDASSAVSAARSTPMGGVVVAVRGLGGGRRTTLDAIERLRYAEDAMPTRSRGACAAPPQSPGHRRRRSWPLDDGATPPNPAPPHCSRRARKRALDPRPRANPAPRNQSSP